MLQFFAWYLTITLLGLLTFPLAYRLLPALADRGYALSRALGLLIWGFVFWLAVSFGLAQNNTGGLLLALAVLAGLMLWANWTRNGKQQTTDHEKQPAPGTTAVIDGLSSVVQWLKSNLGYVLSVEVLFLVAFGLWAFVRANNADLTGTEKPMEIAFIDAIMHSPTFPPHDPWLSGYAISYYYFGYVMTAMLAEITATIGSVAFNLMLALIFGLSAIGAYGLLYNLLGAYWTTDELREAAAKAGLRMRAMLGAFLAPVFLIVLGNWEGFLEVLHRAGIGWTGNPGDVNIWSKLGLGYPPSDAAHAAYNFWTWLNMKDLSDAPATPAAFVPDRYWWWWRASRVVTDYDLRGNWTEIIDEFPFFSYLLGDLHPHVLAMPFGLLAGALALNLYLGGWKGETKFFKLPLWGNRELDLKIPVRLEGFALLAVALGGLAFLNTWDFPIYTALVCGALVLMLVREQGWKWDLVEQFLQFAIPLGLISVLLYLPFYIGFSSQASGIIPNVIFPTRTAHLWVMFGGMFVPIFAFLIFLRGRHRANWGMGFALAIAGTLLVWLASLVAAVALAQTDVGQQLISSQGVASIRDALGLATLRRLEFGGSLLTLVLLIGAAAAYLTGSRSTAQAELEMETAGPRPARSPLPFILMFILFGGLLVLAPEFFYLRDQFGSRMNTIFKFYYEAWALWSVAAAFAIVVMLNEIRRAGWMLVATGSFVLVIAVGLVYPALSIPNKTNNFGPTFPQPNPVGGPPIPPSITLDGAAYLSFSNDYPAIQFLSQAEPGTVAEAVGDSYQDQFAVVATYSGQPTVLGWQGHEIQWRGGTTEMGSRAADIQKLYTTTDWTEAQAIIKEYDIRYIYLSTLERQTYHVDEAKFSQNLAKIYDQGQVTIYVVP